MGPGASLADLPSTSVTWTPQAAMVHRPGLTREVEQPSRLAGAVGASSCLCAQTALSVQFQERIPTSRGRNHRPLAWRAGGKSFLFP